MMTGWSCRWSDVKPTLQQTKLAITLLDSQFIFVGLTEHWSLSVCLFHAMFGGPCRRWEFAPGRCATCKRGKTLKLTHNTSSLMGWRDEIDAHVYTHASEIFWRNVAKYKISK